MKSKAPAFAQHLVLMVKAPVAGRVKTRLARGVGVAGATAFYRSQTAAILGRTGNDRRWRMYLAVSPNPALYARFWPPGHRRFDQGAGDLGQRMQRIMDGMPPGPVIIIGTDVPAVRASYISQAFQSIGGKDAVFGPAPDGGYWLVGLRRRPRIPKAFRTVRWSTSHALADTLANLANMTVAQAAVLDDVDEDGDLKRLHTLAGRRVLPMV